MIINGVATMLLHRIRAVLQHVHSTSVLRTSKVNDHFVDNPHICSNLNDDYSIG